MYKNDLTPSSMYFQLRFLALFRSKNILFFTRFARTNINCSRVITDLSYGKKTKIDNFSMIVYMPPATLQTSPSLPEIIIQNYEKDTTKQIVTKFMHMHEKINISVRQAFTTFQLTFTGIRQNIKKTGSHTPIPCIHDVKDLRKWPQK